MNNKKFLSLVLSLVMVLGTFTSVFAASEPVKKDEKTTETKVEKVEKITGKDNKIQYIIDKKFVEGYEDGDYGYDKNIKRSEITKLLVFANGHKELSEKLQGSMKVYSDVDTAFWANGVITVGTTVPSSSNNQAMLNGYPNGTFLPERNVTYAELAKMLVVLAKEDLTADMVKTANANWASQWMTWAAQLGILDDVTVANSDAFATRADAFTMLYNALYKMQNFKREAANDEIGILSKLSNKVLTLNQDSEQEYKITDDTVFVKHNVNGEEERDNVVKVSTMKDAEFYKGSLVRIMFNDKKEITHILELGNPEEGALANRKDKEAKGFKYLTVFEENNRWDNVADATISTEMLTMSSIKDNDAETAVKGEPAIVNGKYVKELAADAKYFVKKDIKDDNGVPKNLPVIVTSYAEIGFDGSKLDVKNIKFHEYDNDKVQTIKVDDEDVRVFVANPANNQMKELKDVYEALRLIGYSNKSDVVPNVYVGYDDNSSNTAIGTIGSKAEAKVIVFNIVSKDNDMAETYRVVNEVTSKGDVTLENTDGKKFDENQFKNTNRMPFNSFEKLDVVEYTYDSVDDSYDWEVLIEHDDTDKYPIVEIDEIDGDVIVVKDNEGRKSILNIEDADIFTAKQDFKEGSIIQFALEKDGKNNVVNVISILDKNTDLEGDLESKGSNKNVEFYFGEYDRLGYVRNVDFSKTDDVTLNYTYFGKLLSKRGSGKNDSVTVTENLGKALDKAEYKDEKANVVFLFTNDDFDKLTQVKLITISKDGKIEVLEDLQELNNKEVAKKLLAEFVEAYNKLELYEAKLTLKDEAKYEKVKAMYDNLSDSDKTAVAKAIKKVEDALAEDAIFDQLEDAKTDVKNEISKAEKKLIELEKEPETNASAIEKLELGLKVAKDANLDASTKSELETIKTDLETAQA